MNFSIKNHCEFLSSAVCCFHQSEKAIRDQSPDKDAMPWWIAELRKVVHEGKDFMYLCMLRAMKWSSSPYWLFYRWQLEQTRIRNDHNYLLCQQKKIHLLIFVHYSTIVHLFSNVSDCELEELEAPQRYRPDSLAQICKTTKFSESEIKRMYRGFKAHCPNGMVKEDTFKIIYGQFFPQGG